jgi:hypothetical protein
MDERRANGAPSTGDVASELSAWLVGGGIVTMALFPFALPLIGLVAIGVIPLLLIPLAGGLVVALVAVPILLVRGLGRAFRARPRRPSRAAARAPTRTSRGRPDPLPQVPDRPW